MATRSVITVTTGEAGSGKSYARCARFITDRFLRDHDGVHWSNFPLGVVPEDHAYPPEYEGETFRERIAATAASLHKLDQAELLERIQTIPKDELDAWERGDSGPWEFFEGRSLQDAHIAIDEIHNYCDAKADAKLRKRWKQWLGEIRHQGATVEFLSQALQKVPIEIRREAGCHIAVKNAETERDPVFGIEMGDWYELRGGFLTRRYSSHVVEQERRSAMGDARKFETRRMFPLEPWYFRFYDSFSAPQKGGNKGRAQRRQFERRSRIGLLAWFIASNAGRLVPRAAFLASVCWLLFGHFVGLGGGPWLMKKGIARMQGYGSAHTAAIAVGLGAGATQRVGTRAPSAPARHPEVSSADVGAVSGPAGAPDRPAPQGPQHEAVGDAVAPLTAPAEVAAKIVELRDRIEELELENKTLRSVIERTAELAAIAQDGITFRNGFTYAVGEVIDYGPHAGRTVERIRWRQRAAELDDGTLLRMGGRRGGSSADELLDAARGSNN